MKNWWDDHDLRFAVAEHAVEIGELTTAAHVLRFFEKPWHFQELYDEYDNDQSRQGELADESRYQ